MSNFSSLKNVPPAFQNLTTEKVWKKIREPFTIAILASLGFHGLLWFGLPLFSSSATKQPEQRTLNVVELSPLEQQARLPQTPNLLQPIPTPTKPAPANSPTGAVPMVPVNPTLIDPGTFYQIPDNSTRPTTPDFSVSVKPAAPKPVTKPPKETTTVTEPTDTAAEKPDAGQPSTRSQDLTPTDKNPLSKSREEQEKVALQQSFAFNATGTSSTDVSSSLIDASQKIAGKFKISPDWGKPIPITVPYPKTACQFQHQNKPVQGATGLAVVLMPDGSFGDTALKIKSSGFSGLDQAAIQFVEKQWSDVIKQGNLEPGQQPKAYVLEMTITPTAEDCAGTEKPTS
jgi:hypothetical protein